MPSPTRFRTGRLLRDSPRDGAINMAIDAVLLRSVAAGDPPTLRFYGWAQPTLSLGYFQSLADRGLHPDSGMLPVVRRSSGGGALVHDHELTYSLALPGDACSLESSVLYRRVHDAIRSAVRSFGIRLDRFADLEIGPGDDRTFLCFQRRNAEDLLTAGYKVLGSAQRKDRGGVLQHGGLLLAASRHAPELPGLRDLTGHLPALVELQDAIARELGAVLELAWEPGELSATERSAADQEWQSRFGSDHWTQKR